MTDFLKVLQAALIKQEIALTDTQLLKLETHWQLVKAANAQFNLTAIKDDLEAANKHYLDCLLLAAYLRQAPAGAYVVDIGSGAGFPGLVLAIACPDLRYLLLESVGKKSRFLAESAAALGLDNIVVQPLRAEEVARQPELRGQKDFVLARAVAALPILLEYALPLLKLGGYFIALKGPSLAAEEQAAENALTILGAKPSWQKSYLLPDGSERIIAAYQKVAPTPDKYPRRAGMAEKRPL